MFLSPSRIFDFLFRPIRALFSAPARLFSTGKRMWGMSLPTRAALVVALFLIVCAVLSWFIYYTTERHIFSWQDKGRLGLVAGLILVIPILVYWVVRLWMEGSYSPFSDIDRAWSAGVAEMAKHGIDPAATPLFLVLGPCDDAHENALFEAAHQRYSFGDVPSGPGAIHWYGSPEAVYVVCSQVGCLSDVVKAYRSGGGPDGRALEELSAGDNRYGTIIGVSPARREAPKPEPAKPAPAGSMIAPHGYAGTYLGPSSGATSMGGRPAGPKIELKDHAKHAQRLKYLCQLIRRTRAPVCPNNGILAVLPYGLIARGELDALAVREAVARDLASIHRAFGLRCPVTALVVDMDEESGFLELVRRVNPENKLHSRFGKGMPITTVPKPECVEALAAHACGAFEDSVYRLFGEDDALKKTGNTKLYALLCKVRRRLHQPLEVVLVEGFGVDTDKFPTAEPMMFSGCYFAATGALGNPADRADREAFVRGVFAKLRDEADDVQWRSEKLRHDRRYRRIASMLHAVSFLLFLAIVGLVGYRLYGPGAKKAKSPRAAAAPVVSLATHAPEARRREQMPSRASPNLRMPGI